MMNCVGQASRSACCMMETNEDDRSGSAPFLSPTIHSVWTETIDFSGFPSVSRSIQPTQQKPLF